MLVFATLTALAMSSPWWEGYATSETFLCPNQGVLIIERNDAQASVVSGRFRTTLFRENSDLPGLRYGDDRMRVIIRGDVLTLEQLPDRFDCMRSQQA